MMKKIWMRRVMIVLALCLLFSKDIAALFMRTLAVEEASPAASSVYVSEGDETASDTESDEELENNNESVSEGDETVEDELLLEQLLAQEKLLQLLAEGESQYTLPESVDDYLAAVGSGRTEFYISTATDFLIAQALCEDERVNGFEGITLIILSPGENGGTWDIGSISGFTGIGTTQPFKGTLTCFYSNGAGVQFQTNKPLIANMGDGAVLSQMDIISNGSCAAIAQNISGNVTVSNIWLRGTIGNGSGTVGLIASSIASDSTVSLINTKYVAGIMPVNGTVAGGIAGTAGSNVTISFGENVNFAAYGQNTVTGTEAAGGYYGIVTGNVNWNLAEQSIISSRILGNGGNCYSGQFAGQFLSENGAATLTITGGNTVTAQVAGAGNGGGLVGLCGEGTNIVVTDGSLTISGGIDGNTGSCGGVAGVMVNPSMELSNYTITAKVSGRQAGGIVGEIQNGKCIIRDVKVAEVSGTEVSGGVIGNVTASSAIELQGTIQLTSVMPHGNGTNGLIVGKQDRSLIYLSEVEGRINGVSQISPATTEREEIGTYGGLYRNQNVSGGKLIGNGTLEQVGVINNTVAKSGDWYQLKSVADFENLAIVLGTEGAFGSSAFGKTAETYASLLSASYSVTNNVDISYDKTGIVTLNRNDKSENGAYAFSGKMAGTNPSITITQNSAVKQKCLGLFSSLTGGTEFSNLVLEGTVENGSGVGGLAYEHIGSGNGHGLTLTNFVMKKTLRNNSGWIGGVMARKTSGGSFALNATNITLASTIEGGADEKYSGFITYMINANLDINGVTLGGKLTSTTSQDVGGFFGRSWSTLGGTIKNVTVQAGTEYTANGAFGVLLTEATNDVSKGEHLTLDTVKLNGLTVNANPSAANCSLLIRNAKGLVADIVDYDSTGCVVNNPGANFDEVAGMTRSNPNRELPLPASSGIISLHSRTAYFPTYHYENKVESLRNMTNSSTMYYYDVFQYLENADGTVKTENQIQNSILDKPEKVLLWNVLQMATDNGNGHLRDTFKKYFADNYYQLAHAQTYYFKGTLDLSTISYYPTPNVANGTYIGQNDAKIIFGAKTNSVDMGEWTLSNERVGSQHFGLQGGLLYNDYGNMALSVRDITFSGQLANLDLRSGALVTGEVGVADGGSFTNITLDNLWVADYNGTAENVGLLISKLPANTVTLDGIRMTGYPKENNGKKAAAALIGYAGGEHVTNMVLNFSNMVIADERNSDNHNGDLLAYASFIFEYNYTDNTEINTGSGIYLFTEEDAGVNGRANGYDITTNDVTYGEELDDSTEFADSSRTVLATMGISNSNYIPYVYKYETIEVNPKAGDILKGCGTYDDPYIITDEKQFLTLYRYMNERELDEWNPTYQYDSFYEQGGGWELVALGDDSSFCETKHAAVWDAQTGSYNCEVVAYGDANFPTPEELSHAYFMLGADIDLATITNETYKAIANDFVGFGTDTRPFAGVWYGNGHTITLPEKVSKTYPNYGFIQYAQGAVVKDMTIQSVQKDTIHASNAPYVNESGGGVMATVLGGDNIIDNVTLAMDIKAQNQYAPIGGYVGIVKKGGVILRNVTSADLNRFRIDQQYSSGVFNMLGAIIGKVEDGYVVYEGSGAGSGVWNGISTINGYPACPNFNILNADTLKQSGLNVGAPVTEDGRYINITVNIPDATGLQIMAMALNADALNVRPSDFNYYTGCGYTEKSRSRKANYDAIGSATLTQDYLDAAKYDNVMGYSSNANKAYAYPYLYDYMGITGDAYLNYWVNCDGDGHSVLNPSKSFGTTEGTKYYRITWELAEGGTYDMSQGQFGNSFRGIGASYQMGNAHGGTFHGNFYGNNSTIILQMERRITSYEASSNESLSRSGLFNTIYGSRTELYDTPADFSESAMSGGSTESGGSTDVSGVEAFDITKTYLKGDKVLYQGAIYQLTVADSFSGYAPGDPWGYWKPVSEAASVNAAESGVQTVAEEDIVNCFEIRDFKLAGSIDGASDGTSLLAGGVVACIEAGNYIISNVSVDSQNPLSIGAVNGKINHFAGMIGWVGGDSNILIRNCAFVGTQAKPIILEGSSNSGGLVGNNYGRVKIENVQVDHLQIDSAQGNTGGMVGYTKYGKTIFQGTANNPIRISNSAIEGELTGGLVGKAESPLFVQYAECVDSTIGVGGKSESAGGLIGYAKDLYLSNASCEKLKLSAYNNEGGIVGETTGSSDSMIMNVTVKDLLTEDLNYYTGRTDGIGGIVGKNASALTIQEAEVLGTQAGETYTFQLTGYKDKLKTAHSGVGGLVGYHVSNTLKLQNCKVDKVLISTDIGSGSTNTQIVGAGGLVGYVGASIELSGNMIAQNLTITAPKAGEVVNNVTAAGGAFGYVNGKIWGGTAVTYYKGLTADSNAVTGKYAGGLMGYINGKEVRLSGIKVANGTVQSDEVAGGIIGLVKASSSGFAFNKFGDATEASQNQVLNMDISGRVAGGVYGQFTIGGPVRNENLLIQGNNIVGQAQGGVDSSAGGLIGVCDANNNTTAKFYNVIIEKNKIAVEVDGAIETDCVAVGGVIGQTISNTSTKVTEILMDNIVVENTNRIGVQMAGTDDVLLIKADGTTYQLSPIVWPTPEEGVADYSVVEKLEQEFGCYIGSVIGVFESNNIQFNMICSNDSGRKFVSPVMGSNPPVVDVGRNSTQGVDDYRSNCHIVYGAENAVASKVDENLADMMAQVEKVKSDYVGNETYEELLTELRVSEKAMELFELTYRSSYQFPETDLIVDFPIVVYRVQDGTLQEVMDSITDVMTNMAGASTDLKQLKIECKQMFHDGTVNTAGTPSIAVTRGTDNTTTYSFKQYDGLIDGKMTYTELTYTYGWSDESGSHQKIFRIPVFVEEPILYSVHSKIMEGKVSDVTAIRNNGTSETSNNIIMANDSDYTLLLEYTYGEARKQMIDGVAVDKVFYLEQNGSPRSLPIGTQLLLVDVTGGNKAYYYTVEDENVTHIKFTDFKDRSGVNQYVNQSINTLPDAIDEGQEYYTDLGGHELTETGVERFLLTVFSNDNDTNSKVYSIHLGMEIEDENLASRFQLETDHAEESVWNVTAIPGLKISLAGKGSDTDVSGEISKTEGLTVKAAFQLWAQDVYWVEKNRQGATVIDSSNTAKYLEIAFYLRDNDGNRVRFPEGTNFSYKLSDGSYSGNRVIPDESLVYYYKDIRNLYGIEDFEYLVGNISGNTTVPLEFKLDFGGADLSTVLDDSYIAWIELLRTANREYPMGNGNTVDSYQDTVEASAMQELGFALHAKSLEELAINTYPVAASEDKIHAQVMFDFSESLEAVGEGAGIDMVLEKWSEFEYEVTYQIYKKTGNGYVAYADGSPDIILRATNSEGDTGESGARGNLTMTYRFTADQIARGNGDNPVMGVLSFPCEITQATSSLVADSGNLTNYRVEATLVIKEDGVSGDASSTTDFFVYTVTKLKTDL